MGAFSLSPTSAQRRLCFWPKTREMAMRVLRAGSTRVGPVKNMGCVVSVGAYVGACVGCGVGKLPSSADV